MRTRKYEANLVAGGDERTAAGRAVGDSDSAMCGRISRGRINISAWRFGNNSPRRLWTRGAAIVWPHANLLAGVRIDVALGACRCSHNKDGKNKTFNRS